MFTTDSRAEQFLVQMGVKYEYHTGLKFNQLEPRWRETNEGRPVPLREEAVVEYASLMENSSSAPAPILLEHKSGKYHVLDGVQRLAAAELIASSMISAYVVRCDSEDVVASIRVLANIRLQGRAERPEWTKRKAVEVLVLQRGLTTEEVARMGGWRAADVASMARAIKWQQAICDIGGPKLSDAMIERLSSVTTEDAIRKNPQPIATFLDKIKQSGVSASDSSPYLEHFFSAITKESKAHATYSSRLKEFLEQPEIRARLLGRRGVPQRHDVSLRKALKSAITILDEIEVDGDQVYHVDEFFALLKEIDKGLRKLSTRHKASKTCRVPADMWSTRNE